MRLKIKLKNINFTFNTQSYCKEIWAVLATVFNGCFIQIKDTISMIMLIKPMVFLKTDLIASQSIIINV